MDLSHLTDSVLRFLPLLAGDSGGLPVRDIAHEIALDLAIVFLVAIVVVRLIKKVKFLPKVTIYLVVGLVLGPSVMNVINVQDPGAIPEMMELSRTNDLEGFASTYASEAVAGSLEVMRTLALAIILFLVGTEFRLEGLRGNLRKAARVSLFSGVLTFCLTAICCYLAGLVSSEAVAGIALPLALVLAIFAMEVGPASTLAVVREHSSHGVYTDSLKLMVGYDNLLAIITFTAFSIFFLGDAAAIGSGGVGESLMWLLLPIPLGVVLGLTLAWVETFEEKATYRLVMVLATLMAAFGFSRSLDIAWLMTVMIAGFAYANASVRGRPAVDAMRILETPFYVIFFIYTGANLHLDEIERLMASAPLVGLAYIVCRSAGKYVGTVIGARTAGFGKRRAKLLGGSVLAHSAVVLALLSVVQTRAGGAPADSDLATFSSTLTTLLLGSVVVFEVFGPILVKLNTLRSGEVAIVDAVGSGGGGSTLRRAVEVCGNFLHHLGIHKDRDAKALADLVIADRRALAASADFTRVTKFIEHYAYDSFPVLDPKGYYMGFISFNEIKDSSYDPLVKDIVRAADMISSARPVDLDTDDIESAYEHLRQLTNTALPVIRHDDDGHAVFVGIILQRDLAALHVEQAGNDVSTRKDTTTEILRGGL